MIRSRSNAAWHWLFAASALLAVTGCMLRDGFRAYSDNDVVYYRNLATGVEYPDLAASSTRPVEVLGPPRTIYTQQPTEFWDLSLQEAINLALQNSRVMRDLGGTILRSPQTVRTVYGPAIEETDPQYGIDAALSAFDAEFSTSAFFEKNDRALNNVFFGGGTRLFEQDAHVYQTQISKRTATGTQFALRHNTDYDANNAPGNRFGSAWNTNFETEFRHPLLQGAGLEFNRIAGPGAQPGVYNGVLLARTNVDMSLAEFETAVVNFVSDVENAYWDLYFAYRDLDAKIAARNAALDVWRRVNALYTAGRRGGEAEKEAHAREQYFRFEEEVQNALTGALLEGTHTNNGSSGGTFRGNGGVHTAERRLRLLLGLPINDAQWIRPSTEPTMARTVLDWEQAVTVALAQRPELRRQRWAVKRYELEVVANRNFLLPQLDAIGRWRWRGFGHDLINSDPSDMRFDNAYEDLFTGDFQEWQLGMELSIPIGFRRAHAAVRNAQLLLARERALLHEQEREIVHNLSNAVADIDRAYAVVQTTFNRRQAARQYRSSVEAAFESDQAPLDLVLESHRRLAEADSRYYRALVEHAVAIKNTFYEQGDLLRYNEIYLAEGPWPYKAYRDAERRESLFTEPGALNYILRRQAPVTGGPDQGAAIFDPTLSYELAPQSEAATQSRDESVLTPPAEPSDAPPADDTLFPPPPPGSKPAAD